MQIVTIRHRTIYRYGTAVELGDHELMVRPRATPDVRIIESNIRMSPLGSLRSGLDRFGNALEVASFSTPTKELVITSMFRVAHTYRTATELANEISLNHEDGLSSVDSVQIAEARRMCSDDPVGNLRRWAENTAAQRPGEDRFEMLRYMNERINDEFKYSHRDAKGTQSPTLTIESGSGTCRDFAYLMVEAARCLDIPARFVSGYLYDDALSEGAADILIGGRSTHAWAQVYLAGAGWVDFDPTNDLVGSRCLIPSAFVMQPTQALPVEGTYFGTVNDFIGMDVDVAFKSHPVANNLVYGPAMGEDAHNEFQEPELERDVQSYAGMAR
jgi:transglutaminase-like putative cysteine protease